MAIDQAMNVSIASIANSAIIATMENAAKSVALSEMSPEAMGQRLVVIREAFGLSQAGIADLLEIERPAWNRFENGKRAIPYDKAARIVDRFGVSLDYIVLGRWKGMDFEVMERLRRATS
ncbi:helix-turn-helix transcriptional regulator [Salipiger sp. HF18]|nr:helix-turn-helix transcriptional regulator [Salipiger sp. HF18]